MTKHEAARLIVSRDPLKMVQGSDLCAGIECKECFGCEAWKRPSLAESDAALWLYHTALAWLAANPEAFAERKPE